ncbi:GAF domain-containing protein [Tateyamaria pelophila]|uniref:GAF domain-containing protein n=1 Tax=Tateyamaria pelophila TaxID=328415 RepID=UPI001CBE36E4|nr:GAF domain-containing protein [Tateyamaria pelophila]
MLYDIDFSNLDEFGAAAQSVEATLNCKACLISVVHDEALAALGRTSVEPMAANQTASARDSICAHTVRHGAPVRVPDISRDPSLRDLPTVRALKVEAYIGVPLRLSTGEVVGAICGLSSEPRIWTEGEVCYMVAMADLIESKIERHILRFEQSQLSKALAETDAILSALAEFPDRALTVQSASGELLFVSLAVQTVIGLDSLDMLRLPRQVNAILDSGENEAVLRLETFGRSGPEVRVQILPIKSGLILTDWTLLKT